MIGEERHLRCQSLVFSAEKHIMLSLSMQKPDAIHTQNTPLQCSREGHRTIKKHDDNDDDDNKSFP